MVYILFLRTKFREIAQQFFSVYLFSNYTWCLNCPLCMVQCLNIELFQWNQKPNRKWHKEFSILRHICTCPLLVWSRLTRLLFPCPRNQNICLHDFRCSFWSGPLMKKIINIKFHKKETAKIMKLNLKAVQLFQRSGVRTIVSSVA